MGDRIVIREKILKEFSSWDLEKQKSELEKYKALDGYSPLNDKDYELMEMVIDDPNKESSIECDNGVCNFVSEGEDIDDLFETNLILMENENDFRKKIIDMLKNQKVINYYKSFGDMSHSLSLYKAAIKQISNDKFISKFKSYLDLIPTAKEIKSVAGFNKWEKNIYNSDTSKIKNLDSKAFLNIDINSDDKLKINHENIQIKDVTTYKTLAVLLILDLLNGLSASERGSYVSAMKTTLKQIDSEKDAIQISVETDEEKEKDLADIDTLLTDMENMHSNVSMDTVITGDAETIDINDKDFVSYLSSNGIEFRPTDLDGTTFDDKMKKRIIHKYELDEIITDEIDVITAKRVSILEKVTGKTIDSKLLKEIPKFPSDSKITLPMPKEIPSLLNEAFKALSTLNKDWAIKLIKYEKAGEGKGEKFIEFVFPYATSGGQESYDIKIGPQKYEVKTYNADPDNKTITETIRLGQEGNIFKSDKFNRLFTFISDLSKIFDEKNTNYDAVTKMLSDAIDEERFQKISSILHAKSNRGTTLVDQIKKGEFSYDHMDKTSQILDLLNIGFKRVKNNNFYYLKIFLNQEDYNLSISPRKPKKIETLKNVDSGSDISFNVTGKISKAADEDVKNAILRILANGDIFTTTNYLETMIDEGITKINEEFNKHPMIIIVDHDKAGSRRDLAAVGIFNKFRFTNISQNGFKVIPEEYKKTNQKKK